MARRLAWWVRAANELMAPAARCGQRSARSSFGELRARAARRTGVPERPDPQFLADLQVLHQSFLAVPDLSVLGWYGIRAELLRHLENRLRLRACLTACPEIAAQPVPRPVFVVGLPRTGTTLLHGLLAGAPEGSRPGYLEWYVRRDATADYAYLKQQLQVLQWNQPARRWILKSPFHLWKLDALLRVFPDATLVWPHRDPAAVIASWCSMAEVIRRLHNRRVDLPLLGDECCQLWARATARAMRVRAGAPQPVIDISYPQLAADPVLAVADAFRRLDVDLTPATRQRLTARLSRTGRAAPGTHHYTLARYGLTSAGVREAFASYLAAFPER